MQTFSQSYRSAPGDNLYIGDREGDFIRMARAMEGSKFTPEREREIREECARQRAERTRS